MERAKTPFYQKLTWVLISLTLISIGLTYGRDIILPLLFSILVANLLLPAANYLVRKRFNRTISILIPLLFAIVMVAGLVYFLSSQIMNFVNDVPSLEKRINEVSHSMQVWFKENTSMTITKQNQYIKGTVEELKENAPGLMSSTMESLTNVLAYVVLMPVYIFLILYYRVLIKQFLIGAFSTGSEENIRGILIQSTKIAQRYLTGLLLETALVFTLNTAGFWILGIKHAVFLALLAALLNLIPYIGMLFANVLCMTIAVLSGEPVSSVVWVGIILAAVQFLDNNVGMPLIVGNQVRINALVTIVGILIGGTLCGIPGMFLAIPGLAILKVIFDKVPDLQPWGLLLGDEASQKSKKKRKAKNEEVIII